ncbi:MAG: DEAD/DEAH box helicase [Bacteroidia bacterium]
MALFSDYNFKPELIDGLLSMGYKQPTPIQEQAMPIILNKQDVIACAQTGTGKTAAFLLPIINNILNSDNRHLNTLIIAPTRELVLQIDQQIDGLAYFCGVSSIAVYGGNDGVTWTNQKNALENGAEIVCATPGRLIALLQSGGIDFSQLQHLVLDEADRMLDMGFFDDIKNIIKYLPTERQTILFSATMPPKMRQLANQITKQAQSINIAISKPAAGIKQLAYNVFNEQKDKLLDEILSNDDYQSVIIFSSTKDKVKDLERSFLRSKFNAKAFHSDIEQVEREAIMREFKSKRLRILIGTDILSRGIDVDGISLVVNYDVPPDPEDYIHRIGRTARAEKTGVAITFVNPKDQYRFLTIENLMGIEVEKPKLAEEYGATPLYNAEEIKKPSAKSKGNFKRKKFFKKK